MIKSFFRWKRLALLLLLIGPTVMSQQEPSLFTIASDQPAITRGPAGEWDGKYTDPGAVVYHDGLFHMFRNGFQGWPASVEIDYWTSEDGLNWTQVSEGPVLFTKEVPYARVATLASSVHVEEDGTWVLYFYTWNSRGQSPSGQGEIGRATASNPLGPWTVSEAPVLTRGKTGEWDANQVSTPIVIPTEEGYMMYYSGVDRGLKQKIGMATSEDGIVWTKYDDPATTEAAFASSDPVMTATETWEAGSVQQPRVVLTPDGWVMIYRSPVSQVMRFSLATSEDGIHWTKYAGNPVMSPAEFNDGQAFWYNALVYHEGTYYLYVEVSPSRDETNIFSTSYTGTLPPDR